MRKFVLTYGLIAGAVLSAAMLLTLPFIERIGFDRGAVVGYTSMVLAFLMVFFGVRGYRDQQPGGRIGFWRAFGVGVAITLVASACYVLTWQVIQHFFVPDFADRYAAYAIEQLRQAGAPEAKIAAAAREMEDFKQLYRNPLFNIGITLLEPLPIGLLFSLGSAAWLSRRPRASPPAPAGTPGRP